MRYLLSLALISALFVASSPRAQNPEPPLANEPEVLTRGPIHEAYATAVTGEVNPGAIASKVPPALIEELPPDEKPAGENVEWIPGYWSWDEDRSDYIWLSGFWRVAPPNRQWVPGTWRQIGENQWQWSSGFWAAAEQQQVEYLPPPPPQVEAAPPPSPGENYSYAPGVYVYHQSRYMWRPGFWYQFRPGWIFVPAHYVWTPIGYVFVEGYWDYPLQQRGVLFCPVYITPAMYAHRHFVYRPTVVVYSDGLYGALFVRPGCRSYFFGDYFAASYTTAGYRSWIDIRIGGGYDPLWGYYRNSYRHDPTWAVGVQQVYAGRFRGDIARPPVTWAAARAQHPQINSNNTTINNTVVNNITNVNVVAPITQVDKSRMVLAPTTQADRTRALNSTKQTREASIERVKLEAAPSTPPGTKPDQPNKEPRRVQLPKMAVKPVVAAPTTGDKAPPPVPTAPKVDPNTKVQEPNNQTPRPKDKPPEKGNPNPKPNTPPGNNPVTPVPNKPDTPPTPAPKPNNPPGNNPATPAPKPDTPPTPAPKPNNPPGNNPATPAPKPDTPPTPAPKPNNPPPNNNPPSNNNPPTPAPKPNNPPPQQPPQQQPPKQQPPPKQPPPPNKKPDEPKEKEKKKEGQSNNVAASAQTPRPVPPAQAPKRAPQQPPPQLQRPNNPPPQPKQPPRQERPNGKDKQQEKDKDKK